MSTYWIRDQQGLTLGPVGLEVLKDLAAAKRLGGFTKISQDGQSWHPVMQFPEVARMLSPAAGERATQETGQAQKVRAELRRFQFLPTAELFGVVASAPVSVYRQGFLALAKPYHPARLPRDVHPELLRAHMEMFQYLSGRMVEHEKGALKPRPAAPAAPPPPPPHDPEDAIVLGPRHPDGRLEVKVELGLHNAHIFTQHKLVNYAMGGLFLPCARLAPLGTWLEMYLHFDHTPSRDIHARGSVVWENLLNPAYPKGFGVKLEKLKEADHAYVRGFLDRYQASKAKRA